MRKMFFILSLVILSLDVKAACTTAPNCTDLGFTKTVSECEYGSIKCPWNTAMVYCSKRLCQIGWIYYADGTCSANVVSGKTTLGVVVYVTDGGKHGQVMSAWPIDEDGNKSTRKVGMVWSTEYVDISSLPNDTSYEGAMKDFSSCDNTDKIVAQGDTSMYPAAWATKKYAPTTETKGKWCLPAAGVLSSIYNNQSAVQAGITKLGGVAYPSCCTWASLEYDYSRVWDSNFNYGTGLGWTLKDFSNSLDVRPVLEF